MKKLLLAVLCSALLLTCGCAKRPTETGVPTETAAPTEAPFSVWDAEIIESSHMREKEYMSFFETRMIDAPLAAVHLEAGDDYSDEALRATADKVVTDIMTLAEYTGEAPRRIAVYAADQLLKKRIHLLGDHLICTAADVESGEYREALIGACYDITIPWVQAGLTEIVFGSPSEIGLKEYYEDGAHALTASCAAVYLVPGAADDATVTAARQTSASIASFVLETKGFGALKAMTGTEDALPAWAARLGIEAPVLPDGSSGAAIMTAFKGVTEDRICEIRIDNIIMYFNRGGFAETPDEIFEFACRFLLGADIVLAEIEEESPSLSELARERFRSPIVINVLDDPTGSSRSFALGENIDLRYQSAAWHELVHVLIWTEPSARWLQEAAAERFSYRAKSIAMPASYDEAGEMEFLASPELSEEDRYFYTRALYIYLDERGSYVPSDLIDYQALRRSYAICSLLLEYDPAGEKNTLAGAMGAKCGEKNTDPYALSYDEAAVMLDYLIDTYGSENILSILLTNEPLEEVCAKDYPELFADFIAYLNENYGGFLSEPD